MIGWVPSTSTVWRALAETGEFQVKRIDAAIAAFRRYWWGLLEARPEGFSWLQVAGVELTGLTVLDIDATIVPAASGKHHLTRRADLQGLELGLEYW